MHRVQILWLFLFVFSRVAAQDEVQRTFHGGITVGANITSLQGDVYDGYHKVGLNLGAVVHAHISDEIGAMLEFTYSQKGCRGVKEIYSSYVGNMFEKYYVDLNYAEIPVQVILMENSRLNFGGGIAYGWLIKSKESLESDQPYNLDNNLYVFRKEDWSFLVSCNFKITKKWTASLRYQQSFVPIRTSFYTPPGLATGNQFNSCFTLRLVGFML